MWGLFVELALTHLEDSKYNQFWLPRLSFGCENNLQSWNPILWGVRFPNPLPKASGLGTLTSYRQSKKFHCKFTHTYGFSGKKRNVISKKGGGSRSFGSFPKKHKFLSRRSSLFVCGYIHKEVWIGLDILLVRSTFLQLALCSGTEEFWTDGKKLTSQLWKEVLMTHIWKNEIQF